MATNKTFDQIEVGDCAEITRVCSTNDLLIFAHASGNRNPLNLPDTDWTGDGVVDTPLAPSMWVGALISAVLGNILPGPGTVYKKQTLAFDRRVAVGDSLTVRVEVTAKRPNEMLDLETTVSTESGDLVASGMAEVVAPKQQIEFDASELPALLIERHRHFNRLITLAKTLSALPTAVVAPDDESSLEGAILAGRVGLIGPIL
ncbi:MAG: enoyl-CoA hydratase, partial [Litoreibacter sp.]